MKQVLQVMSRLLFYIFAAVVVLWTSSLTVQLVQRVLPNSGVTAFFALALFDGGGLIWLLVFVSYARGLQQRATALLMMVADLVGVVLMSLAELFLGGQTFAAVPTWLGETVVWLIGIWTLVNVAGAYYFHVASPDVQKEIERKSMQDEIEDRALAQARADLDTRAARIAEHLGRDLERGVLLDLGVADVFGSELSPEMQQFSGLVGSALPSPIAAVGRPPFNFKSARRKDGGSTVLSAQQGDNNLKVPGMASAFDPVQPVGAAGPAGAKPADAGEQGAGEVSFRQVGGGGKKPNFTQPASGGQ